MLCTKLKEKPDENRIMINETDIPLECRYVIGEMR